MGVISEETVRRLAAFRASRPPVVSLYLDVDGRRWPRYSECEARAEQMVRRAAEGHGADGSAADLRRVESHLRGGVDRSRARGLAIFASGRELWQVFELAVRVRDQLVIDESPHVSQLEAVVHTQARLGVLLADRQRARMFVFEQGELVDRSELFDELPRHDDDRGDWDRDRARDHVAVAASQHLRRAAQVAFEVYKQRPFGHLALGVHEEMAGELERELHSYLRDRLSARIAVAPSASETEIAEAALEVSRRLERSAQAALVDRVRQGAASGNGRNHHGGRGAGVTGLEAVLAALIERRVDTLAVSEGYEAPGWQCRGCGRLASRGPACPLCAAPMDKVDDVVGRAVEEALLQSCRVEVCAGNADLDVVGSVAALLRF